MAGIGDYKKGAKFTLRSGNTPAFKMMGSKSPHKHLALSHKNADHSADHKDKGLFESITGKKFKDTKLGQDLIGFKEGVTSSIDQAVEKTGTTLGKIEKNISTGDMIIGPGEDQINLFNEEKKDVDVNTNVEEKTDAPQLSDAQMGATNLHKFYKASGDKLPSISDRRSIYESHGGEGRYTGSKEQNIFLLDKLKGGGDPPVKDRKQFMVPSVKGGAMQERADKHNAAARKHNESPATEDHYGDPHGDKPSPNKSHHGTETMMKTWDRVYPIKPYYTLKKITKLKGKRRTGDPNWSEKASELHGKIKNLEEQGATVETSRRLRTLQNKLNKELGSKVRHKKNILTGEYKKKIKK
jgi:hypothetical protein